MAAGELPQSLAHLTAARDLWTALHLDLFRARTERDLAEAHRQLGDSATAEEFHARALDTFQHFGSREYTELKGPTGPT
ncbi:tetratricopeptide repeat protein [Streptomyces scabiei]|nr:tetratricopeptide repeat protein [Streptomyces scabiei]